jgi:alpha-beta hydrolase superfamily lysophospholipase
MKRQFSQAPAKICTKFLLTLAAVLGFSSLGPAPALAGGVLMDSASPDARQSHLPIYEWRDSASKRPRSIIVLVHGATQEVTCFDQLARRLAKQGFLVCGLDLRGHGQWHFRHIGEGKMEGYTVDYNQSVKDVAHLIDHLQAKYPQAPIFCVGESAGAAVLVNAGVERPDSIKGLVLASVGTRPMVHKLDWVLPDIVKGFKNLTHPLEIKRYVTAYSSDDPRVTKEMNEDPLGRHTMSGKELIATGIFIRTSKGKAKELPSEMPLLILQGTEDQVCSPTSVKAIVRKHPGFDKQLVYLRNCGHVLLGTQFIKPQVSNLVVDWLTKHNETALAAQNAGPLALSKTNPGQL